MISEVTYMQEHDVCVKRETNRIGNLSQVATVLQVALVQI